MWKARNTEDGGSSAKPKYTLAEMVEIMPSHEGSIAVAEYYLPSPVPVDQPEGDEHLLKWAIQIGPGVSWQDIEAWERMSGVHLTGWEADTLMMLSQSYKSFLNNSELESPYGLRPETAAMEFAASRKVVNVSDGGKQRQMERYRQKMGSK